MSNSGIILIDGNDSQVHLTGAWYLLTADDPDNTAWQDGTLNGINGATASFTFAFSGSQVAVYGTLRGQNYTLETPTESTYNIDNVFLQDYVAPQVTVDQNKVSFFDSGDIGAGNHSLSVIITSATDHLNVAYIPAAHAVKHVPTRADRDVRFPWHAQFCSSVQ
ncbi:hypothetical protein EW026_g5446 [Hermanssonia centrifuga]|uniref:Uncharacterized protein n=1 Tax=Hermanssonia centrifuga TaxID=98765 RepID=A0A4S4KE42_9APHY|nr:hypothetical protein EW026_g5446 [Hermanssonia centrifuga]